MNDFTGVLVRRAYIDQAAIGILQTCGYLVAESANTFIGRLRMVGGWCIMRNFLRIRAILCFPLGTPAVQDLEALMTIKREQPERVGCIPVILVAIKHDCGI